MPQRNLLQQIDLSVLFGIASRLVSNQTVEDANQLKQHIFDAARIATHAALRIAGVEDDARAVLAPEQEQAVRKVVTEYTRTLTEDAA